MVELAGLLTGLALYGLSEVTGTSVWVLMAVAFVGFVQGQWIARREMRP